VADTRPAVPSDADAIARVHAASWQEAYRDLLPSDFLAGLSVESRAARWVANLAGVTATRTRVALVDGEVCGFASVGPCRDPDLDGSGAWEVYALYLSPGVLGRGIGRDLMAAALGDVPPEATTVTLWVLAGNVRARAFYEAAGFVADGRRQDIEIGGVTVTEVRHVQPARARPTGRRWSRDPGRAPG
jgi:ribosomal protein S18 acetylase RimI-like enzyme